MTTSLTRFTFIIFCLLPVISWASVNEIDSTFISAELSEVRVASIKTNKHNLTPASISLVGPAMLRTQQLTEVSELSGVLPNFFIPEYGSKQTTPIAIRGIMSKVKGTAVGFYVDGMPHFEISSFDSDLLDVKAIEIYRGPQGTLYGRNTLGGVINIYTYSPFEYQGTKVRLGYGNYNNINAQVSHYAKFSESLGLSVGGYYKHRDGYFTNEFLNKKADNVNEAGGKIGLFWRASDLLTFKLISNLDYLDQGGYPYAPYDVETGKLSPISYNRECGFNRLMTTNGLGINFSNDSYSINSQTTIQYLDECMKMDQDYTSADTYFTHLETDQYAVSEELTFKSENDSRIQWIAGAFIFHQLRNYCSDTEYTARGYNSVNDYEMPTTGVAAFAQLSYNFWRDLSATVGIRFDYEKSSEDYVSSQVKESVSTVKSQFDSNLSTSDVMPKFGIQYKWDNRNVLFGNITRGCKAGGFNSVFENDDERTYDDEFNWNYEAGFKATSSNNKLSAELTLFYIDWRRQHISRMIPGLGTVIYNAGHSSSKGAEAAVAFRPITGLMIQANYGFTYAKFIDYKKSDTQDYSDNMIPMVPRNTVSFIGSYSIAPSKYLDLITFSVNTNGVGKLYWLEDNQVCQHFYNMLGFKVSASKGPLTFDIWGKNITNTEYLNYYFASSSKFAQDGTPATLGATLNLKF